MAKRKRRAARMSGISVNESEAACARYYKGNVAAIAVCKKTAGSIIRKIVASKHKVCTTWCGCGK
jgi:hypothetical protein